MVVRAAFSLAAPCFSIHRLAKKPIMELVVVDSERVLRCSIIQVVESRSKSGVGGGWWLVSIKQNGLAILGNFGLGAPHKLVN